MIPGIRARRGAPAYQTMKRAMEGATMDKTCPTCGAETWDGFSPESMLDGWQRIVGEWADATFPASSQATIIAHLRSEVNEEIGVDCDPSELADVGLLLLHLAHKRGVSLDALMRSKHEVNKRRTWQSTPNERGFMSHTNGGPDDTR